MKALASLWKWFATLIAGEPHFVIGANSAEHAYMLRWHLIPRNGWVNVYLHKFLRDDDDRALHDHPWPSLSFVLRGGYVEHVPNEGPLGLMQEVSDDGQTKSTEFSAGAVIRRSAEYRHRIELHRDAEGNPIPAWTLFFTGPRVREWGFWCEGVRFVHWREFCLGGKPGEIGRGCGEMDQP